MLTKNAYVVNSENIFWWNSSKEDALKLIEQCKKEGQEDIRFTYSKIEIDENDQNEFNVLEDIEVFSE